MNRRSSEPVHELLRSVKRSGRTGRTTACATRPPGPAVHPEPEVRGAGRGLRLRPRRAHRRRLRRAAAFGLAAVNDYGIRVKNRIYDSPSLTPLRRQDSGIHAKRGLCEVHRDPYDVPQIWVRDHRSKGRPWIQATWKQLHRAPVPFGDLAWDHVSHQMPGSTEAEIADAVASLLTRAHAGPMGEPKPKATRRDRRVAARTKAAGPSTPLPAQTADEPVPAPEPEVEEKLADVIPLGLFDPLEDPWRRR